MTTNTPNLGLVLYNSTTDQSATFATFRADVAGTASSSNFYKIDTAWGTLDSRLDILETARAAVMTEASFISLNYYEATVPTISSYNAGMSIILKLDNDSNGTVTLNINSLGTKSVMKINSSGVPINISAGELQSGKYYLFIYDGTRWVWCDSNSSDQIYVTGGISGNFLRVSSDNTIEDSGYDYLDFAPSSKGVTNGDSHDHSGGDGNPITILPESISFTGVISPPEITSDQNDYSPSGLSSSSVIRLSSDASRTITGIAGGSSGKILVIFNVGLNPIIFVSESASSLSQNRFLLSSMLTLSSNQATMIEYDPTSIRWRVIGGVGSSSSSGATVLEAQVFS